MRILAALLGLFIMVACKPKKTNTNPHILATPPALDERIGYYQSATAYAAATDFEFEVDGKPLFVRVSYADSTNMPDVPANLTVFGEEGPPDANPLLIGSKYRLSFGPNESLKSIKLVDPHDPSDVDLPAIPENYSGLLSVGPSEDSRAYLSLFSDLSAILLINYEPGENPLYKYGRWTRADRGQKVSAQFGDEEWLFLVKENALVLTSQQMGSGGLRLVANEEHDICQYVRSWLSDLSKTDGRKRVRADNITNQTPLSDVLRTEHAYMSLYGNMEEIFKVEGTTIGRVLRANPTVQGVCDLVLHATGEEH